MPARLFFELSTEKQTRILDAGLTEFAEYGYECSSTNRIVRNAGISKGSLFQYFSNKEDFYFYLLDQVTEDYVTSLETSAASLSTELFPRITEYAVLEFTWYIRHPVQAKLILQAFSRNTSGIHSKVMARYEMQGKALYRKLMRDVDSSRFQWEKEKILDILEWFLEGFNTSFIAEQMNGTDQDWDAIQNRYVEQLSEYMKPLETGLLKHRQEENYV